MGIFKSKPIVFISNKYTGNDIYKHFTHLCFGNKTITVGINSISIDQEKKIINIELIESYKLVESTNRKRYKLYNVAEYLVNEINKHFQCNITFEHIVFCK